MNTARLLGNLFAKQSLNEDLAEALSDSFAVDAPTPEMREEPENDATTIDGVRDIAQALLERLGERQRTLIAQITQYQEELRQVSIGIEGASAMLNAVNAADDIGIDIAPSTEPSRPDPQIVG